MKTDPSSENPSAAPDKSHQAAEKTNTSVQTFMKVHWSKRKVQASEGSTSRISLGWCVLKDRRCKSRPAEISKIRHRPVTQCKVWSSPPGEPSVASASYPPRSPWIAALTSAVLPWLRNQGRGQKNVTSCTKYTRSLRSVRSNLWHHRSLLVCVIKAHFWTCVC